MMFSSLFLNILLSTSISAAEPEIHYAVIDQIEDDIAIIELDETFIAMDAEDLPYQAKEGMVFEIKASKTEENNRILEAEARLQRMREVSAENDIQL